MIWTPIKTEPYESRKNIKDRCLSDKSLLKSLSDRKNNLNPGLIQRYANNMKIENSLQPKNLSKIQNISSNREEHFVTWHLRQ